MNQKKEEDAAQEKKTKRKINLKSSKKVKSLKIMINILKKNFKFINYFSLFFLLIYNI